jgi:hypothetical protein
MANPGTNEKKYPHIVEFAVGEKGVDFELGRRIIDFHKSRRIKLRHGRIILKAGKTYYRWCFSDLAMARVFMEQFGGEVARPVRQRR